MLAVKNQLRIMNRGDAVRSMEFIAPVLEVWHDMYTYNKMLGKVYGGRGMESEDISTLGFVAHRINNPWPADPTAALFDPMDRIVTVAVRAHALQCWE